MTTHSSNNYEKISSYIDLVQKSPRKDIKFFYFDEGKRFIVEGDRLKLLPFQYHKFYSKDEFYIHVNHTDKKIMYYAYDIEDYLTGRHINEEEGYMDWSAIEDCIYNFFVLSIKELTDIAHPYIDVQEPKSAPYSSSSPSNYSNLGRGGTQYTSHQNTSTYGTASYKDREAFYDKLWALIKENKTSNAIDHIDDHIKKMCTEKKFEDLDTLIRMISFDKLNIPTMLELLDATSVADKNLKERKDFFGKVKTHLTKIKPARALVILRNREPGKIKDAAI